MGFLDRVKQIGRGAADLVTAPVGMLWDTARAVTSDEYNPGFGGIFGGGLNQAVTGISQIGQGTGLSALGGDIAEHTPIDEILGGILHQTELLYSTEYQRQTGQAPIGARQLGAQPGDVSIQRLGATATGALGSALPGGEGIGSGLSQAWRRSEVSTPGRAFVDNVIGFYDMSPQQQEETRANTAYNLVTGTIDAASRWMLQPEVLAGKGVRKARAHFNPTPEAILQRATKEARRRGYSVEMLEDADGVVNLQLKSGRNDHVYHVTRQSALEQIEREGVLRVPPGADDLGRSTIALDEIRRTVDERFGGIGRMGDEEYQALSREMGSIPEANFAAQGYLLDQGFDLNVIEEAARTGNIPDDLRAALEPFNEKYFGQSFQDRMNPEDVSALLDWTVGGGAPIELVARFADEMSQGLESAFRGRVSREIGGQGLLGSQITNSGITPRYADSQFRPLYLLGEGELTEAQRYATALYQADPSDMPVILRIKADGLPVIFEDFDMPLMPDPRSGAPTDASLITLADRIGPNSIDEVIRPRPQDMDIAESVTPGGPSIGWTVDTEGNWLGPGYLEPGGRVHPRLFDQGGSPIEPDQIIRFEDIRDDFLIASELYSRNPLEAEKYLRMRAQGRNAAEGTPVDIALQHKSIQQALNWMDGKSADELRRTLFPDHTHGQLLSTWLADAKTYKDRRTILAAGMGYRLPEFDTLAPLAQAKLKIILGEFERVKNGEAPRDMYLAMIGEQSRFKNIQPEQMQTVYEELVSELEDQLSYGRFVDEVSKVAPLREVPRVPPTRAIGQALRKSSVYQESPLSRPVRSVVENKPHRFVNVRDPMGDVQLVRQLEEARPLGVTGSQVTAFRERYMAARTDHERIAILEEAEDLIIESTANTAGMTAKELDELLATAKGGRRQVGEYLNSRRFAPEGRDKIQFFDEDTGQLNELVMPLFSTQVQGWVPLADVSELIAVSTKARRIRNRIGTVPKEILDQFNQIWKPTVLLRGGWPIRVVSDEQLRILAKSGSLIKHLAAIEAGGTTGFSGIFSKGLTAGQRTGEAFALATGTRPLTAIGTRVARAVTRGAEKLRLIDPEYSRLVKEAGVEDLVSSRSTFGGPNESMLHEFQALLGRDEGTILDHLITKGTGEWRSVGPDDRFYGQAWGRVLNDQIGRDPLAQTVVNALVEGSEMSLGMDEAIERAIQAGKDFLNTAEGRAVADRMPWRSTKPDKWLIDIVETIGYYTGEFEPSVLRRLSQGKITSKDLERIDEALRPATVHAEIVEQTLGTSGVSRYIQDFTSSTFDLMGRLPTDTLSRQPFFRQLWAGEMQRLRRLNEANGVIVTEDVLRRMGNSARDYAINETKTLLYDLAEVSRFGYMMRFVAPFYPAWQEVIKVWSGLVMEKPDLIGKALLIWNAPDRAGLTTTDDDGNSFIQFRLSEKMADNLQLTGWSKYLATGGLRVGKSSFNLALNSPLPGVGPLVQIPVNEVVKNKPELEESLQFLLPFGVSASSQQILLSPLVRQFKSELEGTQNDRGFLRDYNNALTWLDVKYRSGELTTPPTNAEALDIARKINVMRLISRLSSPAQPIFDSPLQPYVDVYRDLQENLGNEADIAFLREYGEEFFAVTLSRTVSETGLPPTMEAEQARKQYEDLIGAHPEYGRLIIGEAAGLGEFSSAAFAAQLSRPIDPDNPYSPIERTYREGEIDPRTGGLIEVDRRLGWEKYVQAMDTIDLERQKRGLPNLRVAAAEDLANIKRSVTQALASKYPSWWEDFNTRDDLKWNERIEAFRGISSSPLMDDRPDIEGIDAYLEARSIILQELNRRKQLGGSSTLDAIANQDLAVVWDSVVSKILQDNVAFGPIYYRYLEGDTLELSSG